MYLRIEDTNVSFNIKGDKLECIKNINGKLYKLTFETPKLSVKLFNLLDKINQLDEEFWKPLG